MPGPWRQVIHIRSVEGGHGGWAWILDLDCGHVAVRAQPSRRPARRGRHLLRPVRFAPKKVRCMFCDED